MSENANQQENISSVEQTETIEKEVKKTDEEKIEETRGEVKEITNNALEDAKNLSQQFDSNSEVKSTISESNNEIIKALQIANEKIQNIEKEVLEKVGEEMGKKQWIEHVNQLLKDLEKPEASVEKGYVSTYGSFAEKTSSGQDVFCDTLTWFDTTPFTLESVGGEIRQRLVLIAKDLTNKIIGFRFSDLKSISEDNCSLEASGEIITKIRGGGFSTAIDRVFEKVLTIVANEQKQSLFGSNFNIKWKVENANLRRIKEDIKNKKYNEQELKTKEEEQIRWQSVYGENGKLGFKKEECGENNDLYSKIIKPTIDDNTPRYETESEKSSVDQKDFLIRKPIDTQTFQKIKESLKESLI